MSDDATSNQTQTHERDAVKVVLSKDWAQAVTRAQQLHNNGCADVKIKRDDDGKVRAEPGS
jgi:hypothetical protein